MTISIAWIRNAGRYNELIVASDSRLSSAGHVDICQKVFPLPRGDAFLAFSGDTIIAFPFFFQLRAAIEDFHQATDRSQDVTELYGRVLELLNFYRDSWLDTDPNEFEPAMRTTRFLFEGWSWRNSSFTQFSTANNSSGLMLSETLSGRSVSLYQTARCASA